MNEINHYKINEVLEHKYYQIPQELFTNPNYKSKLTSDSKLLYGFLLDRLTLSQKNNWYDKDGNIYLIFTRQEVQEKLCLSEMTAMKAFKQLSAVSLIKEKRQGLGKPNLIYVGKIKHQEITEPKELDLQNPKNYGSGTIDSIVQEPQNLGRINTNNIKTNIINTESINPNSDEVTLEKIKAQCNLNEFEGQDRNVLENVIENLYHTPTLKVGAVTVNHLKILSMLKLIHKNNLIRLLDIINTSNNITNTTSYLMICLYNNLGNTSLPMKKEKSLPKSTYKDFGVDLDALYTKLSMNNALAPS